MKYSPALTWLAFAMAAQLPVAAVAQDHSGHHGHAPPQLSQDDKHSGHAEHVQSNEASATAADPHAGHGSPAQQDPHAAHGQPNAQDSHAGHHAAPAGQNPPSSHSRNMHRSEPDTPIPAVTAADRVAAFPPLRKHMEHAPEFNWYLGINRLEGWDSDEGHGQAWEGSAWFGTDLNRLWLRSEGERVGGHTESADIEVLYGRSVSAWWDVVGGVRQETRPGPSRTWAAFGMQGLAPYKFEVQATAYVGDGGRVEANVEAEYELLLTNRLILQPLVEVDLAVKDDEARGVGSGLSKAEAGLRLRYEFTRRFAPYVGVVHERAFGRTADLREADGEPVTDTRFVVGFRTWF